MSILYKITELGAEQLKWNKGWRLNENHFAWLRLLRERSSWTSIEDKFSSPEHVDLRTALDELVGNGYVEEKATVGGTCG